MIPLKLFDDREFLIISSLYVDIGYIKAQAQTSNIFIFNLSSRYRKDPYLSFHQLPLGGILPSHSR